MVEEIPGAPQPEEEGPPKTPRQPGWARTRRNLAFGYAYTITQTVSTFVTTPVLLAALGAERYGVWVICNALVSYLELMELGFGNTMTTSLGRFWGAGDKENHNRAASSFLILLSLLGLVGFVVAVGVSPVLGVMVNVHGSLLSQAKITFLLLAAALSASIPLDLFGSVLIAHQRFDMLDSSLGLTVVAQAIGWVVVALAGGGLVDLGLVSAVASVSGQASRYFLARRAVPELRISARLFDRTFVKGATKISRWFIIGETSAVLVQRVDVFLTGLVVGVPAAGTYAVGQRLVQGGQRLIMPASQLLLPRASQLSGAGDAKGLEKVALLSSRALVGMTLPVAVLLMVEAHPLIHLWVGARAPGAATVVILLAAVLVVKAPFSAVPGLMMGTGAVRSVVFATLVEGVANVAGTVLLGFYFGIGGVALASVVAATAATTAVLAPRSARLFGRHFFAVSVGAFLRCLPASLVAAAGGLGVLWLTGSGAAPLVGSMVAVGLLYVPLFWLLAMDSEERESVLGRLPGRSGRAAG